jgi:predicted small secreted protein
MLKRILLLTVLLAFIVTLLGCHTVQGFGEDIKGVGQKGEEILEGR